MIKQRFAGLQELLTFRIWKGLNGNWTLQAKAHLLPVKLAEQVQKLVQYLHQNMCKASHMKKGFWSGVWDNHFNLLMVTSRTMPYLWPFVQIWIKRKHSQFWCRLPAFQRVDNLLATSDKPVTHFCHTCLDLVKPGQSIVTSKYVSKPARIILIGWEIESHS